MVYISKQLESESAVSPEGKHIFFKQLMNTVFVVKDLRGLKLNENGQQQNQVRNEEETIERIFSTNKSLYINKMIETL